MAANVTEAVVSAASNFTFEFWDYLVFGLMLAISAVIGIYFGFFGGKNDTTEEYLLGGRRMKTWPIAISLVASQLSGISIMTIPAEVYSFGITFAFSVVAILIVTPVLCYVVIPVFYNNNISNCYEYLQMRFNKEIRQIVTVSFIITVYLLFPVFIFIPSLAFSQVTGINVHLINAIASFICVFYTMFGGVKAVVWTDVVQAAIMVFSVVLIGCMGVFAVGGFGKVIENATAGGRFDVNMDLNLFDRTSFWNCFIGGFCLWTSYIGFNQSCVQRIVALPSLNHARRSLLIFGIGFLIVMFFNCFSGIIMFSKYFDCDPLAMKIVEKPDKMMPHFVQDIVGHWSGMPGLFISCVFSAALSTLSANMNALSGILYLDYVKPYVKHTERKANIIMKTIVFVTGIFCVVGGLAVENFKSILQVVITISGISQGAIFGVFMLGLLVPRAHSKPTLIAITTSMATMAWIIIGAQVKIRMGELTYDLLPTRTDGCEHIEHSTLYTSNSSFFEQPEIVKDHSIYDISFHWYTIIGGLIIWIVAIPLSYIMTPEKKLDPKLLSPIISPFVRYDPVETHDYTLQDVNLKPEKV